MEGSAELEMMKALNVRLVYGMAEKIREVETLKQENLGLESELEKRGRGDLSVGSESRVIKRRVLFSVLEGVGVVGESMLNWEKEGEIEALREKNAKLTGDLSKVLSEKHVIESELAQLVEEADRSKARVQGMEEKAEESRCEISALNEKVSLLSRQNIDLEKQLEGVQLVNKGFEMRLNKACTQNGSLRSAREWFLKDKAAIYEEKEERKAKIASLKEQINTIDMTPWTDQINNGLAVEEGLGSLIEEQREKIKKLIKEKDSLGQMLDSVKKELQSNKKLLQEVSSENDRFERICKEHDTEIEKQKKSFDWLHSELDEARNTAKDYQFENNTLVSRNAEAEEELTRVNEENAQLKYDAAEMQIKMRDAAEKANSEIESLQKANSEIESLQKAMEGEIDTLKKDKGVTAKKLEGHLMLVKQCVRDKDAMVKEMSQLLGMVEISAEKKKRFWAMVSSVTTASAVASLAFALKPDLVIGLTRNMMNLYLRNSQPLLVLDL